MPSLSSSPGGNRWRRVVAIGGALAGAAAGFLHCCDSADGNYELPEITLGSPVMVSGGPVEESRSEFVERLKALYEALRDQDEGVTQARTAEQIAACVERRLGGPGKCKVNPQNLENGPLSYRPMAVSCIAYDDHMMPTGITTTYIGPICHEFEEMEGYGACLDRGYATIISTGSMAAFLGAAGELDAGDIYVGDAGTTSFQDVYYTRNSPFWDHSLSLEEEEAFRVVEESDTLEPLVDSWSYVCDETVARLENPTTDDKASTFRYSTYLDAMDVLWDTLEPEDMLTKSEFAFLGDGADEIATVHVPIKTGDSEEPIEITMSIYPDSSTVMISPARDYRYESSFNCNHFIVSTEVLKTDPSWGEALIDCSPRQTENSSAAIWFETPERYMYPNN